MRPISTVRGRMLPLDRPDIDTDQIMPKQFLSRVERTGYGDYVFHEWRRRPDFVFNDPRFQGAKVLVAGANFGSGSSREHAVWGLQQYGFDAVIAPSFSDIFVGNCAQTGLLAARVPGQTCRLLAAAAEADPTTEVEVDLVQECVRWPGGTAPFAIDPVTRHALLEGLDDIGLILTHEHDIAAFEDARPPWSPRTVEGVSR
jgi:3-isopropylmalate/(R)-2-methylmalate dehydratase small subunit